MLKKYLICFLVSMVPIVELRGAIPISQGMQLPLLQWSQIVASMDDALLMNLLKQADVTVTEDGNSLEIMVKSISGYNVISREETIAKIEELIEERTGISVRVVCTRIDEDEDFNRRYIALEELVGMDIEIDDKEEFI